MVKTEMRIVDNGANFEVYQGEAIMAKGFPTRDMALHGIWVKEGSVATNWFYCDDEGTVFQEEPKLKE